MLAKTIDYIEDICPVTEFRSDINAMLQKTKATHRPIILTQHGRSTAVVVDIADYQRIIFIFLLLCVRKVVYLRKAIPN
jgi:prevent-host-death family protein